MANTLFGKARDTIGFSDARSLNEARNIVADSRRNRPLWFDGRFLTARDLLREQNYFLTRLMDLSRASGAGVVAGLDLSVRRETRRAPTVFDVAAGHGVSFDGHHLVLPKDITINVADIPVVESVNAKLGLSQRPAPSLRSQSGLFVIALRPVEFTANQVSSYPTHIDGERRLEDGEVVEAVAVTAVPFELFQTPSDIWRMRALAGHQIFVEEADLGVPAFTLPLAMLAMEHGTIAWADQHLVRREIYHSGRDVTGLQVARDQVRIAHYRHYVELFAGIASEQSAATGSVNFRADEYLRSLPATGPAPAASIDARNLTQSFFPPEMQVDLSVVPEDELVPLVEEAVDLPPLDLTTSVKERENTAVLMLVPLPRSDFYRLANALSPIERAVRPAASHGFAKVRPIEALGGMKLSLTGLDRLSRAPASTTSQAAWAEALSQAATLWYVRRRNVSYSRDYVGILTGVNDGGGNGDGGNGDGGNGDGGGGNGGNGGNGGGGNSDGVLDARMSAITARLSANSEEFAKHASLGYEAAGSRDIKQPYVEFLEGGSVLDSPLTVAAVAQRLIDLQGDDGRKMRDVITEFGGANLVGMALLDKALVGDAKVTAEKLKTLLPVTRFEQLSVLSVRIAGSQGAELDGRLKELNELLEAGSSQKAAALLDELAEKGPGEITEFLRSVGNDTSRAQIKTVLEAAPTARRADIIRRFRDTKSAGSRLLSGQVANDLAPLNSVTANKVKRTFDAITPEVVKSVSAFEPFILGTGIGRLLIIAAVQEKRASARLSRIAKADLFKQVLQMADLAKDRETRKDAGSVMADALDRSGASNADIQRSAVEVLRKLQRG